MTPNKCLGCGAAWTSASQLHCTGCHRQFSSIEVFDAHRDRGQCLQPSPVLFSRVELKGCTIPVYRRVEV